MDGMSAEEEKKAQEAEKSSQAVVPLTAPDPNASRSKNIEYIVVKSTVYDLNIHIINYNHTIEHIRTL